MVQVFTTLSITVPLVSHPILSLQDLVGAALRTARRLLCLNRFNVSSLGRRKVLTPVHHSTKHFSRWFAVTAGRFWDEM